MNTIEHDLHTLFSLQAEAMEVPPVGTVAPTVGGTRSASIVPSRRWMLVAAAVVLVVGGGLALAQRQPAEPLTADAVDRSVDLPAAPGTDAAPGMNDSSTSNNPGRGDGTRADREVGDVAERPFGQQQLAQHERPAQRPPQHPVPGHARSHPQPTC